MLKGWLRTALVAFCMAVIVVLLVYVQISWKCIAQSTTRIDVNSTKLLDTKTSPHGYVLVMRYAGQQGAGVNGLVSIQRWVRAVRLPMLIVEPFITKSVVGAYEDSYHRFKFSDMFDLESFNRASRSDGLAEIVPWETYVARAPRSAILVMMKRVHTEPVPPLKVVWAAKPGSRECWHGEGTHNSIKINNKSFCYVRVVLSSYVPVRTYTQTISSAEVCNTLLSGIEPTTVTVVIERWRGRFEIDDGFLPPPASCTYASEGLNLKYNRLMGLTFPKLKDSPKLLRDIENYQQQFLRRSSGSSWVAVMLRAEHAFRLVNKSMLMLHNCLDDAVKKAAEVKKELRTQVVFVTADVGLYGSSSWGNKAEEQVKQTVERLYNDQWMFEQWEKSFSLATGGVEDRGYIAALQRGVASQAACLVMLGGGNFQILALRRYMERVEPHKHCVHFVCLDGPRATDMYALRNSSLPSTLTRTL